MSQDRKETLVVSDSKGHTVAYHLRSILGLVCTRDSKLVTRGPSIEPWGASTKVRITRGSTNDRDTSSKSFQNHVSSSLKIRLHFFNGKICVKHK